MNCCYETCINSTRDPVTELPAVPVITARKQIRRMRGGSQSHLMRCSDGHDYVVKYQNNPQHPRILINEFLGTRLAALLQLPTTPVAIVHVSEELVRLTYDLHMENAKGNVPCQPGLHFGSRYLGDRRDAALDFLPDPLLTQVKNLRDFIGMLVFDKWTCNLDSRQTIFCREGQSESAAYRAVMIDQGFCFSASDWDFPDLPLRGLYCRNKVYREVTGSDSFEPWLERLNRVITQERIELIVRETPVEWCDDLSELRLLGEKLYRRRSRVLELLSSARKSSRDPFPHWH